MPRHFDVVLIRTHQCGNDARVNKMLHLYESNGIRCGVFCISRGERCTRPDNELAHFNLKLPNWGFTSRTLRPFRFLASYIQVLLAAVVLRFVFDTKVLHGCDLDGFLVARVSKFLTAKKVVFEIYDPWSTMTKSRLAARVEAQAIKGCDVLILPSKDGRIDPNHPRKIAIGNAVDVSLAEGAMSNQRLPLNLRRGYILVGGTLGVGSGVSEFLHYVVRSDHALQILVAGGEEFFGDSEFDSRVTLMPRVSWGQWLQMIPQASAVWCWYDPRVNHYASHISPNKYWESCLFGVPLLVHSASQFCDRIPLEPPMLEIGEFRNQASELHQILGDLAGDSSSREPRSISNRDYWLEMESDRTAQVSKLCSWLDINQAH